MSTFKRTKVIMLPAKEEVTGDFITSNGILFWHPHKAAIAKAVDDYKFESQHLYFLLDDEIKEGDWYHGIAKGRLDVIYQYSSKGYNFEDNPFYTPKKIIATTDKSLLFLIGPNDKGIVKNVIHINGQFYKQLPQPSQGFIQKYCEKGGIDEVMVEYEGYKVNGMIDEATSYRPKVSSDNTITIRPIKDSWSREEVKDLVKKYSRDLHGVHHSPDMNSWIKENL